MVLQNFIVFEGIDGAGTSTQIDILKKRQETGNFLFTSEPTKGEIGLFLRRMLKGDVSMTNETAAYLFAADRNEHVNGQLALKDGNTLVSGIKEACSSGKIVVSDRYIFSSLAYQSISCPKEVPRRLNSAFPMPSILFYFDIEPSLSLSRIGGRETRVIYENEDFLNKVTKEYRSAIKEYAAIEPNMKVIYLDATKSIAEISASIWNEIAKK